MGGGEKNKKTTTRILLKGVREEEGISVCLFVSPLACLFFYLVTTEVPRPKGGTGRLVTPAKAPTDWPPTHGHGST